MISVTVTFNGKLFTGSSYFLSGFGTDRYLRMQFNPSALEVYLRMY